MSIYQERFTGKPTELEAVDHEREISFIENYPAPVICMIHGGSPPPHVNITIGDQDITSMFNIRRYHKLVGVRGFRTVDMITVLWVDEFQAGSVDDGSILHCNTEVPATHNIRAQVTVKVNCEFF